MLRRKLVYLLLLIVVLICAGCGDGGTSNNTSTQQPSTQPPTVVSSKILNVAPIAQQTERWCWAASAQMVLQYYGLPDLNGINYQCGIVGAYFGGICAQNCFACPQSIPSLVNMNDVLLGYGPFARQVGFQSSLIHTRMLFRSLSMNEVISEINASRPVLAGISAGGFPFPNFSNHATVIVGYDTTAAIPYIFVNDPFPYALQGGVNPYFFVGAVEVQPGRYKISYNDFIGYMAWGNTLDNITALF